MKEGAEQIMTTNVSVADDEEFIAKDYGTKFYKPIPKCFEGSCKID